jgi:agmatine deiminase
VSTPREEGLAMPAEWTQHERTLMAWPTRVELWGDLMAQAKRDFAATVRAIARFEPLLMICDPGDAEDVRRHTDGDDAVAVVELPIDDSWLRDSGPIWVTDGNGGRAGVDFVFNSWGERFLPYDDDAAIAERILLHLGERRLAAPLVLEGGALTVDGEGTLLTTEQCLLHPTRNPALSREEIEQALRDWLGVERVVWLGRGLVEDRDTDGHVDLVAAFTHPGHVLLQTVGGDRANPNWENVEENKRRLDAAGIEWTELDVLPYVDVGGETVAATAMNFYLVNGGAVVPVAGTPAERERQLEAVAVAYPGREVAGVEGAVLAAGGGGVHCITQQVPVAPRS